MTNRIITPLTRQRVRNPAFQDPQVKQALTSLHAQVNALKPKGSLFRADVTRFIAKPVLQYLARTNPQVQTVFNGNSNSSARVNPQTGEIMNGSAFFT